MVIDRPDFGGDDLQQELQPIAPCGGEKPFHAGQLHFRGLLVVIRVTEDQELDHILAGPFAQPTKVFAQFRLEFDGTGTRKLGWLSRSRGRCR